MSSAWLLPEHIADVLPSGARHIEALRRGLLDGAERYGFELVIPPLLEHIESLLSGTGHELDLKTFKLVDQSSGRTLGLRADSTPQVARIDAHILNREGVVRLCYCGPVLHTRASGSNASREPLQFGAEIYGHAGLEADLEIQDLALESLRIAQLDDVALDLADARIVRGIVAGVPVDVKALDAVYAALAAKDVALLRELTAGFPADSRRALLALVGLYGGVDVIDAAQRELPDRPLIGAALDDLRRLADHAAATHPEVAVGFDLADLSGYAYYSGPRFAVYATGASDAVARGGRYDEVGAIFGRNRPAVGFSLDVKQLAALSPPPSSPDVIRAPRSDDPALRRTVRELRAGGAVIVTDFENGAASGRGAWRRELVADAGRWSLREC
ncbi:ATP phosphoribosyltransferase regulatory subunit [Piscinibacter koreensis]|uniref:ATP phosphoribosyltransferase regulatory subunit n=1 Tax=Piscinibacter koreensis TaxID=2742824 RepID=A0A7Y6TWP7_9BURK|nr:ATP phosphoribosyltransferase regulatory subunit [Schlegelella koreensis]NUZ06201.1 ATP phosphoribosyltransferase regulatory subunit [Schlegelella koreensis]